MPQIRIRFIASSMPVLGQISRKVVGFYPTKTGFPRVYGRPGYDHSVMRLIGNQLTNPKGLMAFRPTLRGGLAFSQDMRCFFLCECHAILVNKDKINKI
jgi:hypothetical protein